MKIHLTMGVAVVLLAAASCQTASAATNPYVSEMPPVERVLRVMTVPDARETALRQVYAFVQLQAIIDGMAGAERRMRNDPKQPSHRVVDLTAEEQRLVDAYARAATEVWRAAEKTFPTAADRQIFQAAYSKFRTNVNDLSFGTRFTGTFGVEGLELFELLFTPEFHARFTRVIAEWTERSRAFMATQVHAPLAPVAPPATAATTADPNGTPTRSAEDALRGLATAVIGFYGNGNTASAKKDVPAGLRMSGDYVGEDGRHIAFTAESAVVTIGQRSQTDEYSVEQKGAAVVVTVQRGSEPLNLVLKPDGTLIGSQSLGKFAPATNNVVTGLRMSGAYEGEDRLNLTFTTASAVVTIGQLSQTDTYRVEQKGAAVVVTVQHGSAPFNLVVKPDGTLNGSGTLEITGDAARGQNNQATYSPKAERCTLGILRLAGAKAADRVVF